MHGVGATLYYDGANLNAVMGRARPGDMGFDIVHYNLHKTFTQPHGGGGPGAGPIAVSDRIEPFLPRPAGRASQRRRDGDALFDLDFDRPQSIGRLRGFQGNYGVFVRSYAYILSLGGDGLQEASETAVLNANYLLARLRETASASTCRSPSSELCMHEFVLTGAPLKKRAGDPHARPGQAAARPRLPPADGLLPAARRRGAADRADRDRDARDARRLRRGDRRRSCARPRRIRRSRAARRTRRRSAGSTRRARPSARSSASRSTDGVEPVRLARVRVSTPRFWRVRPASGSARGGQPTLTLPREAP